MIFRFKPIISDSWGLPYSLSWGNDLAVNENRFVWSDNWNRFCLASKSWNRDWSDSCLWSMCLSQAEK